MMYQQDSNRIWKAITGFSLLIIIMMGSIGIIWSLQTITNLEKKLDTARKAILAANHDLRQSLQARLKLEKQLQSVQEKQEAASHPSNQRITDRRTPLPSYEYEEDKMSSNKRYRRLQEHNGRSSFTIFRGECTSCTSHTY